VREILVRIPAYTTASQTVSYVLTLTTRRGHARALGVVESTHERSTEEGGGSSSSESETGFWLTTDARAPRLWRVTTDYRSKSVHDASKPGERSYGLGLARACSAPPRRLMRRDEYLAVLRLIDRAGRRLVAAPTAMECLPN
jgi:hypothetical protein